MTHELPEGIERIPAPAPEQKDVPILWTNLSVNEWAALVGALMHFNGLTDFLLTQEMLDSMNPPGLEPLCLSGTVTPHGSVSVTIGPKPKPSLEELSND